MQCDLGKLCVLHEYASVADFLKVALGHSKQRIKKLNLPKKLLQKSLKEKQVLSLPLEVLNYLQINPSYNGPQAYVIEEKHSYLLLSKPSYCHIHPLGYSDTNNLLSFVRSEERYFQYLKLNEESYDRSLAYRIDYETSGLVMLSLKERLKIDFQVKAYFAVCSGEIKQRLKLEHCLSRTGKKIVEDQKEKLVSCTLVPLEYSQKMDQTLVTVFLKEGVRHQIRAQLSIIGHPIIGDELYGGLVNKEGLFGLHCFCYQISGQKYIDDNIPFQKSFNFFLNLDSYFQMFSDEFRIF